jgi:hypothetical protein
MEPLPLAPNEVYVHVTIRQKPQDQVTRILEQVRLRQPEVQARSLRMLRGEFDHHKETFATMERIGWTVAVEYSCGCVWDVHHTHPTGTHLCDHHWWEWVVKQVGYAKKWERIR